MTRASDDVAWVGAAMQLDLVLYQDSLGNDLAEHFDLMAGSLRPRAEPSRHDWMMGARHGCDVLVTYYFRDGGSSADTHITRAIARIDPPLFLGLEINLRHFFSSAPKIGVPVFDDRYTVKSFLPEHGRGMVMPLREPALANMLVDCATRKRNVCVTDSYVQVSVNRFESNPSELDRMLYDAAAIARACVTRRAAFGETALDARFRAEWSQFAEGERMAYDPAHRIVTGFYRGDEAALTLRTSSARGWVTARIALPIAPGFTLTIEKESGLTRFGNVIGFSDIEVGDWAFDRELRLKGGPAPLVKRFFENPAVRAEAQKLVRAWQSVRIGDRWVTLTTPPFDRAAGLAEIMSGLSAFVGAASGRAGAAGPYR